VKRDLRIFPPQWCPVRHQCHSRGVAIHAQSMEEFIPFKCGEPRFTHNIMQLHPPSVNYLNSSAIYRHWAFRPLAFMALLFALGLSRLKQLPPDSSFCRDSSSPLVLVKMAYWAGVCLPYTKTHIPSILTSWELHTLQPVANMLPDPSEMVRNRVGKISKIYVCL
jgi:hypothetical protein